jgi:hypothetical protein
LGRYCSSAVTRLSPTDAGKYIFALQEALLTRGISSNKRSIPGRQIALRREVMHMRLWGQSSPRGRRGQARSGEELPAGPDELATGSVRQVRSLTCGSGSKKSPSSGRKGYFQRFSAKRSVVGYLLRFGKGIVELILRDWTTTWLNQGRRMDG